ncbi:hypothetical protein PN466_10205 [Roseofilum reptotaenium CS-1145]|uniref:Uncharacterized protein n=1 Tax=Roseofilum reptotaenium AO1-A TaxID=1925591 RepID=A0A1L9QUE3_9CYAN|nr:hypothetical protein [Roseofilum reptotaenium]MDB9517318.1 hypothetical protein [Roseofilum reptotaenium CS-1145]OJJ26252.1 hypothetical protein BI308_07590 [Roseofilum reptotaenium AO1-A]
MTELKIFSKSPDLLKKIIETALSERLRSVEKGIEQTQERIKVFENQYQLSTEEFIKRFNDNELAHSFDFDEWVGESRMLEHLQTTKEMLEDVYFVN